MSCATARETRCSWRNRQRGKDGRRRPGASQARGHGHAARGQLVEAGIKKRDDLADLAVDELAELTKLDEEKAKKLIMAARPLVYGSRRSREAGQEHEGGRVVPNRPFRSLPAS